MTRWQKIKAKRAHQRFLRTGVTAEQIKRSKISKAKHIGRTTKRPKLPGLVRVDSSGEFVNPALRDHGPVRVIKSKPVEYVTSKKDTRRWKRIDIPQR